jgi:hypothetical protein
MSLSPDPPYPPLLAPTPSFLINKDSLLGFIRALAPLLHARLQGQAEALEGTVAQIRVSARSRRPWGSLGPPGTRRRGTRQEGLQRPAARAAPAPRSAP